MIPLKIGFSPCPNDTFIFAALYYKKIPGLGLDVECIISDVEDLNRMARKNTLDVTKISVGSYPAIASDYVILTSGGALTLSDGPIIVSKRSLSLEDLKTASLAIPGKGTTAAMLLDIFDLHKGPRVEMIFSDIMPSVKNGTVEAGVVIHEGRWIYQSYGLLKILDLGELWVKTFSVPLPLGVIVIKRKLADQGYGRILNEAIKESIRYAMENRKEIYPFIVQHASEMDREIVNRHIEAFVNEFSKELGEQGKKAIRYFIAEVNKKGLTLPEKVFWDE